MTSEEKVLLTVRQKKDEQGYTAEKLSKASGVPRGTLNKILSGASKLIGSKHLPALSKALGFSIDEIMSDERQEKKAYSFDYGFVTAAAASPTVKVANCRFNAENIIAEAERLYSCGAEFIVFPELCLTGYTCGDLFFRGTLLLGALNALETVANFCKKINAVIIVGLPYLKDGRLYNVAAVICNGEILGLVPKTELAEYDEFYEKRTFSQAPPDNSETILFGKTVPFGNKLIFSDRNRLSFTFGVEICEDVWVDIPPSVAAARSGARIIANLSAGNEVLGKAQYRRKLLSVHSAKTHTAYVYSNAGEGESTTDAVYSGHSLIAENGEITAENLPFEKGAAISEIDIGYLEFVNSKKKSCGEKQCDVVYFELSRVLKVPKRVFLRNFFLPSDKEERKLVTKQAFEMQAHALAKRITHVGSKKLLIGVSGGLDSTLALLVSVRAAELARLSASDVIAVTMPCFGTTSRTFDNAVRLINAVGAELVVIDISDSVKKHLSDIGHEEGVYDASYENSQARERTQVLMDLSNARNGIVVGTGDLSEAALGWSTYNGDHMSMYNVNASLPKTLVRAITADVSCSYGSEVKNVVNDILYTPVSPELLPSDGEIKQKTEDILGPYELHDFFLYLMLARGAGPAKMLALAENSFRTVYGKDVIYGTLKTFVKRFFAQQFKRSCMPDSVKVTPVSLSPRADFKMPSDVSPELWLEELENAKKGDTL